MESIKQTLASVLDSLSALEVDWKDDMAARVITQIEHLPVKATYSQEDIESLFENNFDDGKLVCRLFLGQSKDNFEALLADELGTGGTGIKRYQKDPGAYIGALIALGLNDAMQAATNREPKWYDVLVERLRSGRGSAISGQRRGRDLEDTAEAIVQAVFGDRYDTRCQFAGKRDSFAKCDFAIPSKDDPRILIEAKGYNATGSKMTDVVGDVDAIINAKRHDTYLLLFTDGLSWKQRQSDLAKLIERQNQGEISRIYTTSMVEQLKTDLKTLKNNLNL